MTTRKKAAESRERAALPPVYYSLHTLLHTLRCISQHEDRLCTLLHEIRQSGSVSGEVAEELRALLAEMPGHEYAGDLEAVEDGLAMPVKRAKKVPAKKKAAKRAAAKKTSAKKVARKEVSLRG